MFLSHKFRLCLTEQMIFITLKKRSSQIWRVSVFENRALKLVSRFFASYWEQCSRFLPCDWHSRGFTVFSNFACTVVKPAFFVVLHLQDPSLQCSPLSRNRNASVTGGRTSLHQLSKFIHISSKRISHKPFLYLIRICPKIPVKLNSSGLEVFRLDRFGVDVFELNRLGLITCKRWDLCWSVTLPWTIAGKIWVENHRACLWKWHTVGNIGEVDEMGEREVVLVVSVRYGKEWDMTRGGQLFWGHTNVQSWALQLLSHACSRDEMWSCCATLYVLYLWVYCSHSPSVGWRFFSQATETCPNSEKKSPIVKTWRMLRIPIARLPLGLVPRWRWWRSCLQVGPRSWRSCLQVSPRPFVEPPTCFRVNCVVMFFVALKLLSFFAVLFVDCEEWLCILLGSLPGARRATFCILFLLEQSRVVDWVVVEVLLLHLPW